MIREKCSPSPRVLRHAAREPRPLGADLVLDSSALLVVEGRKANEQLIGQHTHGPGINGQRVVEILPLLVLLGLVLEGAIEDLRGHVLERPWLGRT